MCVCYQKYLLLQQITSMDCLKIKQKHFYKMNILFVRSTYKAQKVKTFRKKVQNYIISMNILIHCGSKV